MGKFFASPWGLIIILAIVLIIFGPKNLPKLGSAIGEATRNLRDGLNVGRKKSQENAKADDSDSQENVINVEAEELPAVDDEQASANEGEEEEKGEDKEKVEDEEDTASKDKPKKRVVRVVKKSE